MLTELQHATLHALVDRIIPADDFPSGWQAGVGDYLAGQFERDLRPQLERYRAGLDALDAEAQANNGARFAELDAAAQDALLRRVEAGTVATSWPINPAAFFQAAIEHAMEGFYSDPGNGGNRDGVSWRMIGFEVHG
ncbi:MAG: gluconate 2-dehydrogenase subunit 3 family protein [Chloroflexota bacterium]|nr:gluconate 2-dehydrogenase subunit 3 family protein [Chloroflexota bacterium]